MQFLKANTAIDVLIGPFVDSTDGATLETGLTISQADVLLSKNGQTLTQKNDVTAAAADSTTGYYNCELDATDTNTEGGLVLTVSESGALPVRHEYMVLAEAAYDSMFTAKDTGYMDVNVKAVSEDTTAADNLESACDNYSATRGLSGTALPAAAADAAGGLPISDAGGLAMDTLADWVDGGRLDAILDLIYADTNELDTAWANGGRLDNILDAVALEATVGALNNISAADVNAQVADVMKTDTISEMSQGAPTVTPTAFQVLNYLYRELIRNKVVVDTNTANQKQVFADDGTTILYEKDLTNASNITTIAEATTGA